VAFAFVALLIDRMSSQALLTHVMAHRPRVAMTSSESVVFECIGCCDWNALLLVRPRSSQERWAL